jgi:hypothetical protein
MSYDDLRTYLKKLKDESGDFGVRIDWSVIDPANVEARTHDSLMGLQIADAVASSFYYGVEQSPLGFNEPRYAHLLKPVVYRYEGRSLGYGLKFWPLDPTTLLEPQYDWLDEYGRKKNAGPRLQDPAP